MQSSSVYVEAIGQIGAGWTGDEAVSIAVYCTLKHFGDFESAIVAAVNHKGDSDSTGAVTGNLIGAIVGYDAIPQYYKDNLELHDVILHVADDLLGGETGLRFAFENRNDGDFGWWSFNVGAEYGQDGYVGINFGLSVGIIGILSTCGLAALFL